MVETMLVTRTGCGEVRHCRGGVGVLTGLVGVVLLVAGGALVWQRDVAAKRYREFDERSLTPSGMDQHAMVTLTTAVGSFFVFGGVLVLVDAIR